MIPSKGCKDASMPSTTADVEALSKTLEQLRIERGVMQPLTSTPGSDAVTVGDHLQRLHECTSALVELARAAVLECEQLRLLVTPPLPDRPQSTVTAPGGSDAAITVAGAPAVTTSADWTRERQRRLELQELYDEYAETYEGDLLGVDGKGGLHYRTPQRLEAALLSRPGRLSADVAAGARIHREREVGLS